MAFGIKEVKAPTHERIPESAEIGPLPHLLCKNVGRVGFTTDVGDCNGTFVDPFTCNILF